MVEKRDVRINDIPLCRIMFAAQGIRPRLVRLSHFRSKNDGRVQFRPLSITNKKAARFCNQAAILFRDEKLKRRRRRLRTDRLRLQLRPWLQLALRGASH